MPSQIKSPLLGLLAWLSWAVAPAAAQDILSTQLDQGFGQNKVRYKDFKWMVMESQHLQLYYEPEFAGLAQRAVQYLEEAYTHISQLMRHELSSKPPIVIFKSHYEFEQTNIIQEFLPPGVAGFAEPLRYRMVIPFDGDLDEFRNVLTHELMHIFQYDVLYKGPIKRLSSNPLSAPPTWIMEGLAEYATERMSTIDEMVLRDAVLTDELIPLKFMDAQWGVGNVFLAYKQSHSLMQYLAANYGPEKISRILRAWDSQNDTDKLLEGLIDLDMDELDERWSAQMRKHYWPLLQSRDYLVEIAHRIIKTEDQYENYSNPRWSLSGDMLAVLSTDGVEEHVDIIRLDDGSLVERLTTHMRTSAYDQLTFGSGPVAWAPDGRTIAFVAKKGPRDVVLLWDLYDKKLKATLELKGLQIIESLDWAPDSRRLALVGTGDGQSDIYVADTATGQSQQLTGTPQRDDFPAWSPDGQRLAFSAKQQGQFDIKVYDFPSGKTQTLIATPTDDLWPLWLPEGNKLLFVSTREKINDLFLYHLDEGQEYRLTRTISGIMTPALSPDGTQLVLVTYYHGRRELYRMKVPSWPDVKKRSAILAARAAPQPAPADSATAPAPANTLASPPPEAALPQGLVDQALRSPQAVKLAQLSDPLPRQLNAPAEPPRSPAPPTAPEAAPFAQAPAAADSVAADSLPRRPYTPELEFDGLSVQMGYFNGFFSSIAQLSMSDLLGNHDLSASTDYVTSQQIDSDFNFALSYTYYGQRPTYNVALFNWNQFFNDRQNRILVDRYGRLVRGIERSRQSGMLANISYPLDIYRRVDLSYTFVDEQSQLVWPYDEAIESFGTHLFRTAYVHDSISYGLLGPTIGRRFFLSAGRALSLVEGDRSFSHLDGDYRHYRRLGRWSVLGLRATGVSSLGRDGLRYNLGGPAWFLPFYSGFNLNRGPLRGYRFTEFEGTRVLLLNTEVRVPFIRNITFGWPGTFAIPAVDGSFFLDVGAAWNEEDEMKWWPLHNPHDPLPRVLGDQPEERRLHGSIGFGMLVYFLLPMNFEFAKQTDLRGNYSDYKFHFSFGKSF
ncbi:MAG: PD40 domain-containing protein [Candidatus Handelsmanbacteria bacterium]|nr:PD40 domain-containing protein [Candidatus Handelsmanbacteria bacterium]